MIKYGLAEIKPGDIFISNQLYYENINDAKEELKEIEKIAIGTIDHIKIVKIAIDSIDHIKNINIEIL